MLSLSDTKTEGRKLTPPFFVWKLVFLYRSIYRANASARTAVNALVGVNYVLTVYLADATNRALALARTACNAVIGNFISHDYTSKSFILPLFYHIS
jgi:hypothetical protein